MPKIIIGFGNPLMDTTVFINDEHLLNKYNLKIDGQKEMGCDEMNSLRSDIKTLHKSESAGGCAQNTLKIMKWLMKNECTATIFGSIGADNDGIHLKNLMEKDGVLCNYFLQENYQTGTTVALISGPNRSLVAHLGAAEIVQIEKIKDDVLAAISQADIIYMEGFFITKRGLIAEYIADCCNSQEKQFVFNLSGQYLTEIEPETIISLAKKSDILFGNKSEFNALSQLMSHNNVNALISYLCRIKDGKIVVVTNGNCPVICMFNNEILEVEVPKINAEEIVDTTGAGDAFVGGFLAGYLLKQTLMKCVELGCYAAREIIKGRGCNVPQYEANIISIFKK